jgi:hypothetical protein
MRIQPVFIRRSRPAFTGIENILSVEGRKVKVDWRLGEIPRDLKVSGVSVFVEATLENNKVLDGTAFVNLSTTSATVLVKGGFLNLNQGRREKIKKTRVTGSVISNFDEELQRGQATNIKEVTTDDSDGVNVEVTWDFEKQACDTATHFEVEVIANPVNAITNMRGAEKVFIGRRRTVVRIRGINLRRHAFNDLRARVKPIGRSSIICSDSKTFDLPGSN